MSFVNVKRFYNFNTFLNQLVFILVMLKRIKNKFKKDIKI